MKLQTIDDAARTMLKFRCRYRPGLKLSSPEQCQTYKEKAGRNPMSSVGSMGLLCHQWDCPGPLGIEDEMPPKRSNPKRLEPTVCRECGKAPGETRENGKLTLFYPSRPDTCSACIDARRRANLKKTVIEPSLTCDIHGPHEGHFIGGKQSSTCPECYKHRQAEGMASHNAKMSQMVTTFKKYPFLEDYLREQDAESPIDAMAQIVISAIPAEWFKAWALRGVK